MNKDFLTSQKPFPDDADFDFHDINLTFPKSQSHENRFQNTRNSLKTEENKRKQKQTEDNSI